MHLSVILGVLFLISFCSAEIDIKADARPWMDDLEISTIDYFLSKDKTMLEYGSGSSTVYFSSRVKHLVSVESSGSWCSSVQSSLEELKIDNVDFICRPSGLEDVGCRHNMNSQTSDIVRSGANAYAHYINASVESGKVFDLVLIDGRARPQSAFYALGSMHKDSIVFVHDIFSTGGAQRPHYAILDTFFNIEAILHTGYTMAVLSPKEEFLTEAARINWLQNEVPDWWFEGSGISLKSIEDYILCSYFYKDNMDIQSLDFLIKNSNKFELKMAVTNLLKTENLNEHYQQVARTIHDYVVERV